MNGSSRFLRGLLTLCIVGVAVAGIVHLFAVLSRAPVRQPLDSPLPPPPIPTVPVATPTAFLVSTSTPTPTNPPQPTVTALPIQNPAPDASGMLLFAVREDDRAGIYAINMDKAGMVQGEKMDLTKGTKPQWGSVYHSQNGSRLAVVGGWGVTDIVDVDTGSAHPLFDDRTAPYPGVFFGWHPDNRHVLMRAESNHPDVGLWLVDTETGKHFTVLKQLHASDLRDGAVSPDGQKVIYSIQKNTGDTGEI